ncbi:uncharacterized protein LOC144707014 [Wolffia australiana]
MRGFWHRRGVFFDLSSIWRFCFGARREHRGETAQFDMTRKKYGKKRKAPLEDTTDFPYPFDFGTEHSVLAVRMGVVSRLPNVDPDGKPTLKYKDLSLIYHDGPSSTMNGANSESEDCGDDLSGMTLNELKIRCKRPRLEPMETDFDLDEPLILLRQRTLNNAKSEKIKNKEAVLIEDQEDQPSTSEPTFQLINVKEEISVINSSFCSFTEAIIPDNNELEQVESVYHECESSEATETSDVFAIQPHENMESPEVPSSHERESTRAAESSDNFAIQPFENLDFAEMSPSHKCEMTEATGSTDKFAVQPFENLDFAEMPSSHECEMAEATECSDKFAVQPFESADFAEMPSSHGCEMTETAESSDNFAVQPFENADFAEMPSSYECEMTETAEASDNFAVQLFENANFTAMPSSPGQQEPIEVPEIKSTRAVAEMSQADESQPFLSPDPGQTPCSGEITAVENSTPPSSEDVQSKHPPIRLLSNRKVLSPTTQEKLCLAVNSDEPVRVPRSGKRLCFERRLPAPVKSNGDTSSRCPTKGILKAAGASSPLRKHGHEAVAFSQRQMRDIESLATKLVKGLQSMKGVVKEVLTLEGSKVNPDKMRAAIDDASELEEVTKKWLCMMGKDCNRFCKIMRSPQLKSPNGLRKDSKKITFADEAGGMLCQVKLLEEPPS